MHLAYPSIREAATRGIFLPATLVHPEEGVHSCITRRIIFAVHLPHRDARLRELPQLAPHVLARVGRQPFQVLLEARGQSHVAAYVRGLHPHAQSYAVRGAAVGAQSLWASRSGAPTMQLRMSITPHRWLFICFSIAYQAADSAPRSVTSPP